ncbi:(2Fe-2S)-binding protein [Ottowia thiooxydans]|uniref:(2Fe-2S)-binding protein n=1 Tax=Ottowia thiooxydans TaxID=219182 RepID=UPI000422D704|nr:(2Fe-2S)-binding protein [Ottowia thiooxydans]
MAISASPDTTSDAHGTGAQLVRVAETGRMPVGITIDGQPVQALVDDTVLTAILTQQARLRDNEFGGGPRAGFCLMGACQECWVWRPDGSRLRACSALVSEGLVVLTRSPLTPWQIPSL